MHHLVPRIGVIRLEPEDYFFILLSGALMVVASIGLIRNPGLIQAIPHIISIAAAVGILAVTIHQGRRNHQWDVSPNPVRQIERIQNVAIAEGYIKYDPDEDPSNDPN